MMRNTLNSNSPLITSILASSYALGLPLDDDKEVQDTLVSFAVDRVKANQELEDELNDEAEEKPSFIKRITSFFAKRLLPVMLKQTIGLIDTKSLFKDIAHQSLSMAKDAMMFMTSTFRAVIFVISFIVTHTFKAILSLLFKNPLGIAATGLTAAGLAIYSIANRKKLKEIKERTDIVLSANKTHGYSTFALFQPSVKPVVLTQDEYNQLTDFKASNQDVFTPETEILHTMKTEGWDKIFYDGKEYSKFGIRANDQRSITFIRNLNWKQAFDIYKREYWDAAKVESVPEEMQRIYFNTAVNMGVQAAKDIYRESGNSLEGFVNARNRRYISIAKENSSKQKYLQGWLNRSQQEYQETLNAIKNVEQFKQSQARENGELIKYGKVLSTM